MIKDTDYLNKALIDLVREPLQDVWNLIAKHCGPLDGEGLTNEEAMELTIQYDRLTKFGYPTADYQIKKAIVHSTNYNQVKEYLCHHIKLN